MNLPKIVDNERVVLRDMLSQIAKSHEHLSIATGYWDLPGLREIFENIKNYKSIRLIIGQEPIAPRFAKKLNINEPEKAFPELDFKAGLAELDQLQEFRDLVFETKKLIDDGRLQVKVYRRKFLHAKAYIFGTYESESAVGIIGSSNFTKAGLVSNAELNSVEDDYRIVKFKPQNDTDEYGHLSWFDEIWSDDQNEEWNGMFTQILQDSPVGDLTFGAYDVYIKTLMEVFPDELIPKPELGKEISDILYAFQNRNAGILINKLEKMGMAILADSVGLGKTITAGAVVRHYIDRDAKRIIIIVPASLKQQWIDDLANVFSLIHGPDFQVVSQQDLLAMDKVAELDKFKQVDLFIIDEAHNLRNTSSTRYDHIMDWLRGNPEAKALLLTATPINNSLNDLVNEIQLGLKGEPDPILVPYKNPNKNNRVETLEFFDALNRIQKRSNTEPNFDWESVKMTLVSGIGHYLVRSTRQGVENEGGIAAKDGSTQVFPSSSVGQIEYTYSQETSNIISKKIDEITGKLEGIEVRKINISGEDNEGILSRTQRSLHPFDFAHEYTNDEKVFGAIPNLFQLVSLFGFAPYKPETYLHKIYKKTREEIINLGLKGKESQLINLQLSIHNMLLITWLKRLESSAEALYKSIGTYDKRLEAFKNWLDQGFILSFKDIDTVEQDYGDDIEKAFEDYDGWEPDPNNPDDLKRRGIERKAADSNHYNIEAIYRDIARDRLLAEILMDLLGNLRGVENDMKLHQLAGYLKQETENGQHGNKVIVFSFFADTINYLKDNLHQIVDIKDFTKRSEFLSGQNRSVESIVRRFSPKSKNYQLKEGETELDFLFATDILSEGQNLQDAGILVNYDLHWNPVRMIQRNGRVNRLGSKFPEVLISNLKPEDNIELYLNLVDRLQKKIKTIKHTVGLDQGVLSNADINPIDFVEDLKKIYSSDKGIASGKLDQLESDNDILSWTNDHVFSLREYLAKNNEEDITRIKNIPAGKWNYLPNNTTSESGKVLSLQRVEGKTSITNQPITETFFVETKLDGEYASDVIDDFTALHSMQAKPEENGRIQDAINVDRQTVRRRATRVAKTTAETSQNVYELKPSQINALVLVQQMFPDVNLRPFLESRLRNAQHKRQFEKIVRSINLDQKTNGSVTVASISSLTKLIKDLGTLQPEETAVDEVTPILYYAKRGVV